MKLKDQRILVNETIELHHGCKQYSKVSNNDNDSIVCVFLFAEFARRMTSTEPTEPAGWVSVSVTTLRL